MKENRKVALVVVDHGSRNEASNAALDELVRHLAATAGDRYAVVLAAHMDIAAPSIADAFEAAAAAGADFVVLALYFLAAGRHSEEDVPRLAREASVRHGIDFEVTESLGPDEVLSAIVLKRAAAALGGRRT